jgi:anti-sigma factor RsiW
MTMTRSTNSPTGSDHELLVAYLDGELAPEEALRVEQRLSEDEEFRQLLKGLQDAWDLLDELPQPTLDDGFTQTTVEMVAVRMGEEIEREQTLWYRTPWFQRTVTGVCIAMCCIVGFFIVRQRLENPQAELLRDLPVIEQVDHYTQVENLEFLQALADDGIFRDGDVVSAEETGP